MTDNWLQQQSWWQSLQKNPRLPILIVAGLFSLLALYFLIKLIWLWVDYALPEKRPPVEPVTVAQPKAPPVNMNALVNRHLFGNPVAVAEVKEQPKVDPIENAPETRLNIKLRGVYMADTEAASQVIIENDRNQQSVYAVNDAINVSGNVYLKQVQPRKVIIERAGRFETLTLFEDLQRTMPQVQAKPRAGAAVGNKRVFDKRKEQMATKAIAQLKTDFEEDPQSIAEKIRFEMVQGDDGSVQGFKIKPVGDPRLFAQLGLKSNDVVRSVNGVSLDDPSQAWAVQSSLETANELNLVVNRGGRQVELIYNLQTGEVR